MRTRTFVTGLSGVAVLAVIGFASPASAVSYEYQYVMPGIPPTSKICVTHTGSHACFHAGGDEWWIKDTAKDGYSAVAKWEDYKANGTLDRKGYCMNNLGKGNWGYCDLDYNENGTVWWQACVMDASKRDVKGCSDWTCAAANGDPLLCVYHPDANHARRTAASRTGQAR